MIVSEEKIGQQLKKKNVSQCLQITRLYRKIHNAQTTRLILENMQFRNDQII